MWNGNNNANKEEQWRDMAEVDAVQLVHLISSSYLSLSSHVVVFPFSRSKVQYEERRLGTDLALSILCGKAHR